MFIYISEDLSKSINALDRRYFESKVKGHKLYFSKTDKITKNF